MPSRTSGGVILYIKKRKKEKKKACYPIEASCATCLGSYLHGENANWRRVDQIHNLPLQTLQLFFQMYRLENVSKKIISQNWSDSWKLKIE